MPSPLRGDSAPEVPAEASSESPGDSVDLMRVTAVEPLAPGQLGGIATPTRAGREDRDRGRRARAVKTTIGVVDFPTHRGEPAEVILDGDGRWHCPQLPVLDRVLNILFEPRRGAADAAFGVEQLRRVAAWLKGGSVRGARISPRDELGPK